MEILALNVGSSTLRASLVRCAQRDETLWEEEGPLDEVPALLEAAAAACERPGRQVHAVGHRIVHGGAIEAPATLLTSEAEREIAAATPLAPDHNPLALKVLAAARKRLPTLPHVAVFDSGFHRTLPRAAAVYPIPYAYFERGIRRLGFHGLSHRYAAARAAEMLGRPLEQLEAITAHLGNGSSLAAISAGRSRDTTMGYTPLEGLMMGTRCGSIDPGVIFHLLATGLAPDALYRVLTDESGLLGIAGTHDVRLVLAAAQRGEQRAVLAIEMYVHRLCRAIGEMLPSLARVDALVFTGGIGEHAPAVRQAACGRFAWLGWRIDERANLEQRTADRDVAHAQSAVRILVVHAREDLMIARAVRELLAESPQA